MVASRPLARSSWPQRAALAALLLVLAYAAHQGRRAFIRGFFVDGEATAATGPAIAGEGLAPAPRVRVVLIDGLGLAPALAQPELDRVCAAGWELRIDVGFPTVSLPVQHVLWTGRSQQRSGILYRIARLDPPPSDALPRRVAGSRAIAESHPAIVHSFGFSHAAPPLGEGDALPAGWREGFPEAALAEVKSPSPLVFVHILRVDEAGHAAGAASTEYASAAAGADAILGRLQAALAEDDDVRWLVLADHGHRPNGGHGGAEEAIRIVRGCLAGAGVPPAPPGPLSLRLVDLARALADSLGLTPQGAEGRPWEAIVAGTSPAASTVPRPAMLRWIAALLAAALLLVVSARAVGRRGRWLLVWPLLAELGVVAIHGPPTLSNPIVYPPIGQALMIAATPGWFFVVFLGIRLRRGGGGPLAIVAGILGPPAALVTLAAILAGVGGDAPALMPIWSAQVSVAALLLAVASLLAACVVLLPTSPGPR